MFEVTMIYKKKDEKKSKWLIEKLDLFCCKRMHLSVSNDSSLNFLFFRAPVKFFFLAHSCKCVEAKFN